ncbi:MAG: CRISPR-associated endonuclease Cas2 [Desulfovibrio sp.]|nr:CRISPR-associated endonuclease Cas2 [Desulfovibrio sp.]
MYYLIAYDIADARRLQRIAKIMEDYGRRVQRSIFEAELDGNQFARLQARVAGQVDPEADGVKYFPLCDWCLDHVTCLGVGDDPEHSAGHLVL